MHEAEPSCNRRGFLKICAGASAALLHPPTFAALPREHKRELALFNTHTNERLTTAYWSTEGYSRAALHDINHLLRDHRTGEMVRMDPELLDLLYGICRQCGGNRELHIISAYRSPKTNAILRKRSKRVAKKSYHTRGMAVDLRMPGTSTKNLRRIALSMQRGGVGYYPRSGFIHVDTGPVRAW